MINFEDEDFDLSEGFLGELAPTCCGQQPTGGGSSLLPDTVDLRAALRPTAGGRRLEQDLSCTPDSVSVSQMFGVRTGRPPPTPHPHAAEIPFAADGLLDGDLLDACEAAVAPRPPPPSRDALSANVARSRDTRLADGSHDTQLADVARSRDALSVDVAQSCDIRLADVAQSHATRTADSAQSRDKSPVDVTLSRDTRKADMVQSRDTLSPGAARSRDPERRRSCGGSAVKRRFPGPAGILPITGSLLMLVHEISLQDDGLIDDANDEDVRLRGVASQSQSVLYQPDPADWQAAPWRCMLAELRLSADDPDSLLRRINISAVKRSAANNKLRKVPLLVVSLVSLEATSDLSYFAKFKDPTGEMEGTVARDAFEACGAALRPGAVLTLREVAVWRESARRLYLSVTRRSLAYLFVESEDSSDTARVLKLTEVAPTELLTARLVEELPTVPVLYESPPPSPPRQQLYVTPQVAPGGWRGRPDRGRARRPWRGRGAFRPPGSAASPAAGGAAGPYGGHGGASPAAREVNATAASTRRVSAPPPAAGVSGAPPLAATVANSLQLFGGRQCSASSSDAPAAPSPLRVGTKRPWPGAEGASPALPAAPRSATSASTIPADNQWRAANFTTADVDSMFDDDDDALFGAL